MTVRVRLPASLRREAGGLGLLELDGEADQVAMPDLRAVLDRIGQRWPLLERRLRDERGDLRIYMNLYVDGEECRRLAGLATPVSPGAEILVVASVAGG